MGNSRIQIRSISIEKDEKRCALTPPKRKRITKRPLLSGVDTIA
jgi:hypothetical protein